ncbi:MAG TPA: hypothetical protein VIY73_00975 [Polyangiaceae bacterium]
MPDVTRGCAALALFTVVLAVHCGGATATSGSDGGAGRGSSSGSSDASVFDASASSSPACGPTLTTLVPAFWTQPDAFEGQVGSIAVNGTTVFFSLFEPGSLWSVPVGGGAPTKLASFDGEVAQMLATPTTVVVAESFNGTKPAEILSLPAGGGSPTVLATVDGRTYSLATDGTDVYFSGQGGVAAVPLAGGAVRTVTTQPGTIALAGSTLILAGDASGNVFTIPTSGGTLTPIATGRSTPDFPVSDGSAICWVEAIACAGVPDADVCVAGQGEGAIVCASPGEAPVTLAESSLLYLPTGMFFDGASFFVTVGEDASLDGPLTRVPAAGGTPTVIAQADGVAIADGCAFVIDYTGGVSTVATSSGSSSGDDE